MTTKTPRPLAAGGIRISELAGRGKNGKHLYSDTDQAKKIRELSDRFGVELAYTFEEMDTSGTLPLSKRPKLLDALEKMERGKLKAIIFPYRDRSDRSIAVMTEVVERVDAADGLLVAGGSVLTHKTADDWARSTIESFANEMPARYAREKVRAAHVAAVEAGIPPYPAVPGYEKDADGHFVVVRKLAPIVRKAFTMRDKGESLKMIRRYLGEHGIERSYAGVESMLASETYIGNIVFGDLRHDGAHKAIIRPDLWHRVQGRRAPRGRRPRSDRLLARQGVLVCGSCGGRMSATNAHGYPSYRCQHNASPDCPERATVAADRVEQVVIDALKARRELAILQGKASSDPGEQLHQAAREAKADLEAAVDAFAGVEGLTAAKRRIAELTKRWQTAERDAEQQDQTEHARAAMRRIDDWERLPLDIRRGIIRATIERITIDSAGGRGLSGSKWDAGRVHIRFFGEGAPGGLVE
jgi:hypothetical protein